MGTAMVNALPQMYDIYVQIITVVVFCKIIMCKFVAFRCIFHGNSFRLPQQCSVFIAAGVCRVEDCQITSQSGGGSCCL